MEEQKENIFRELVPQAKKVLAQQMGNDKNPKLAVQVAEAILDRAGEVRKSEEREVQPIIITNSQVALLQQVAREVEEKIVKSGGLAEPDLKELEDEHDDREAE